MASSSDMSFWIKFFKDAGIPAGDAANYAVTFTDHRINRAMLMDLTKEYLNDMGITILGDVISILKHAKTVFNQDVRDRALRDTTPSLTPTAPEPVPRRSTPASRTIGHYIGTDRSNSPSLVQTPKISKELSARLGNPVSSNVGASRSTVSGLDTPEGRLGRSTVSGLDTPEGRLGRSTVSGLDTPEGRLGNTPTSTGGIKKSSSMVSLRATPKEVVPVPKKRRVFPEHEGKYKITMPAGTTEKTKQILALQRQKAERQRIAAEKEKQKKTGVKTSVFSRLGSEKSTTATVTMNTEPTITITGLDSIESSVFNRLGGKKTVKRPATSTVILGDDDLSDDEVGPSLEYAGVLKHSPVKKAKVEAAKKVVKTAQRTLAKAKPIEVATAGFLSRSSSAEQKTIKSRLGPKVAEVSSTTSGKESAVSTPLRQGIQKRLGPKQMDADFTIRVDTTTTSSTSSGSGGGVFGRLGKPKS